MYPVFTHMSRDSRISSADGNESLSIYQHQKTFLTKACLLSSEPLTPHWQVSLFLIRLSCEPTWNTPLRSSSIFTKDSQFKTHKRPFVCFFISFTGHHVNIKERGLTSDRPKFQLQRAVSLCNPTLRIYGPGWLSRYSDSLRAGRSGNRTPVGGGEIFRTRPDWPWSPPSLLYNGYRDFPGGKAAGTWRWPSTSSSAEVKERIELFFYTPLWFHGLFWGDLYLYLYYSYRILIHALIT